MKLLYRIIQIDEPTANKTVSNNNSNTDNTSSGNATPTTTTTTTTTTTDSQAIENIQRPPTPPPSPKPAMSRTDSLDKSARPPPTTTTTTTMVDQYSKDHQEPKKPRCEVTPVMRAPDPPPLDDRSKSSKMGKVEHQHKRKKRRNKRVIAEITTTPREDLLKLKVRLTPCPPRVTSSAGGGSQTKDKLMQMRAVRKEKTKGSNTQKHRLPKEHKTIPKIEEVKRIAEKEEFPKMKEPDLSISKTIGKTVENEVTSPVVKPETKPIVKPVVNPVVKPVSNPVAKSVTTPVVKPVINPVVKPITNPVVKPVTNPVTTAKKEEKAEKEVESPKNEDVLRRLGLVAISEANKTRQEKTKSPAQSNAVKKDPAEEREKLEKQLRESKANRVRSLLAEKQLRDTLKSIMSNSKEANLSVTPTSSTTSTSATSRSSTPTTNNAKRKEPPPLTPLRNAKRPNVTFAPSSFSTGKYESPLDLSSPSNFCKDNALDLSSGVSEVTITKCNPVEKLVGILRNSRSAEKSKEEGKKSQDSNLRTLSDAAVSLLGDRTGSYGDKTKVPQHFVESQGTGGQNLAGKVALRIPQPHQRITGFGMKIKPNIGVRHIPNPQAVVASQYRNQRTGFFNLTHQPP